MLAVGISAAIIAVVVAVFKTKREVKEFDKMLDEIPPWPAKKLPKHGSFVV